MLIWLDTVEHAQVRHTQGLTAPVDRYRTLDGPPAEGPQADDFLVADPPMEAPPMEDPPEAVSPMEGPTMLDPPRGVAHWRILD